MSSKPNPLFLAVVLGNLLLIAPAILAQPAPTSQPIPTSQPASQPAATKDGLSVSITPVKLIFPEGGKIPAGGKAQPGYAPANELHPYAVGERLTFLYTFTNVGKTEFALYNKLFDYQYSDRPDFDAAATIAIVNLKTKEGWQAHYEAEALRKRSNFPTVVLVPGQSWSGKFEFEQDLNFIPQAGGPSVPHLPPGQYQMTVTWKFPPPGNSKIRWWQGEITAHPVPFVIVGQPASHPKPQESAPAAP